MTDAYLGLDPRRGLADDVEDRGYDAGMEEVPAVWNVSPGADREHVESVLARLAERLEIPTPEIKDDMVLLPADYPAVARALEEVEPGWEGKELLIPPVA